MTYLYVSRLLLTPTAVASIISVLFFGVKILLQTKKTRHFKTIKSASLLLATQHKRKHFPKGHIVIIYSLKLNQVKLKRDNNFLI